MKNKVLLLATIVASLTLVQTSNASVININNLDPTDGFSSGGFTLSVTTSGTTHTLAFTNSGATDLDGGGTNDTLTFELVYDYYSGSSFSGVSPNATVTLGTASAGNTNNQNWGASNFAGGNTLSLLVQNISYSDGEGDGDTAVFDGFTGIRKVEGGGTGAGAADFAIGGLTGATIVTSPPVSGDLDISSLGSISQLFVTSQAGNGNARLRDLDLQFSTVPAAIPEPSTISIFGLGIAGLFARRRRI